MTEKKEFVADTWINLLRKIVDNPPSDSMLDTHVLQSIQRFLDEGIHDPVSVWNYYKRVLDWFVYASAAAPMFLALFDLEPYYTAPPGALTQADGSIRTAPWRADINLLSK